jgi:hypothetical protein
MGRCRLVQHVIGGLSAASLAVLVACPATLHAAPAPNCVPTTVLTSWTLRAPWHSISVTSDIAWPGDNFMDLWSGYYLDFLLTKDGPDVVDLGCGLITTASTAVVPLATRHATWQMVDGPGIARSEFIGTGSFLNRTADVDELHGTGTAHDETAVTYAAALAPGIYSQTCRLQTYIFGRGYMPPSPGFPNSASSHTELTCAVPPTVTTVAYGFALVPEPSTIALLATGLALVVAVSARQKARQAALR